MSRRRRAGVLAEVADLLSEAILLGVIALPGLLAALGVFIGRWWPAVPLVVFVVALAVWAYATGDCDPDEYCDEARGFWPIFWTAISAVSAIMGVVVGAAALLLRDWWSKRAVS